MFFETHLSPEIDKIQNQRQAESCAFLDHHYFCDKQTSGCGDHKCAHLYRRVGGMMTDVHVAILSKPLHICENLPPALHLVSSVMCVHQHLFQLPGCASRKQEFLVAVPIVNTRHWRRVSE